MKLRLKKTIVTTIILVIIIAVVCVMAVKLYTDSSDITKRRLSFSYSVCTEQDIADMINKYNSGDIDAIGEYIADKTVDENYSNDGKCVYVEMLWSNLFGDSSGYNWYLDKLSSGEDYENIIELIRRDNGPAVESLNLESSGDESE